MKKLIYLFVIIILNTSFLSKTFTQQLPKPGTEEWKRLPIELRREACNIPENEIVKLTTNELLQKCLNYQFMSDILFTYQFRGGLDAIAESFNGLRELFDRTDAANTIINYYSKLNPELVKSTESSIEKGKFSFNLVFLELYLTQPAILGQLQGQEKTVIKEVLKKINACIETNRVEDRDIYSGFSMNVKGLLIAVLLVNMKDKSVANLTVEYPEYKNVIANLSLSEISEGLFNGLMLRASEL